MSNDSQRRLFYGGAIDGTDLSLRHLEAELLRVDLLIHREVWRWQQAGQDPTDAFRGQYVSEAEANALVKRPFGTSWGQTVALKPEDRQAYATALARVDQHVQSLVETARRQAEEAARRRALDRPTGAPRDPRPRSGRGAPPAPVP